VRERRGRIDTVERLIEVFGEKANLFAIGPEFFSTIAIGQSGSSGHAFS
jgi:hypothetical protein